MLNISSSAVRPSPPCTSVKMPRNRSSGPFGLTGAVAAPAGAGVAIMGMAIVIPPAWSPARARAVLLRWLLLHGGFREHAPGYGGRIRFPRRRRLREDPLAGRGRIHFSGALRHPG